ncbi:MAG: hypothetical protein QW303_07135 [Nitrososphaerota archaeon]
MSITTVSLYASMKINEALQSFGCNPEERLEYILRNSFSEYKNHELGGLYTLYRDEINKIVELVLVYEYNFSKLFPEIYNISRETSRLVLDNDSVLFASVDAQVKKHVIDFHHKIYDFANAELEEFFAKRYSRLSRYLKNVFKSSDSRNQLYRFILLSKPALFVYYLAGICVGIHRCVCKSVTEVINSALNKYFYIPKSIGDVKLNIQDFDGLCNSILNPDEHVLYTKFTDPIIGVYDIDRHNYCDFPNLLAENRETYPSAYFYMGAIKSNLRHERRWLLPSLRAMAYFLTGLLQHEWNKKNGKQTVIPIHFCCDA